MSAPHSDPGPVLVGFDGSDHGCDALALGDALAQTFSTGLLVITAYAPDQWLWTPGTAEAMDREERARLIKRAQATLEQRHFEHRMVPSPSAAGALHAEAERERAEIIVVGASHHGRVGRVVLGTVTQGVLDAAPCAVAVAPPRLSERRDRRFSKVGVAFDDSACGHEALQLARVLAARSGAEVHLLWAAHLTARALPLAATSYVNPDYFEEVRASVAERMEQAAAPLRTDLVVRTHILRGESADALLAESGQFDLLVLGSRGYGPLRSVLLGSISRRVVNQASCPVLVVPRGVSNLRDVRLPAEGGVGEAHDPAAHGAPTAS